MKTESPQYHLHDSARQQVSRRASYPLIVAILLLAVAPPLCAEDQNAPYPRVWPSAAVNVFVLPYTVIGSDQGPLDETASQLTRLSTDKILFDLVKYHSVGVTSLSEEAMVRLVEMSESKQHNPEQLLLDEFVTRQLLGEWEGRDERIVQPGRGLVLLWGFIYVEENKETEQEDVYVQSYLRFMRRGVSDEISLPLARPGGKSGRLIGRLPHQVVAFAPRKLSKTKLSEIQDAFKTASQIYRDPDQPAIVERPEDNFSFTVTDTEPQNGWMQIRGIGGFEIQGWIKADANLGAESLESTMPEFAFIDAVSGYLRCRMQDERDQGDRASWLEWTGRALDRFERNAKEISADPNPSTAAMARAFRGNLRIISEGDAPSEKAVEAARDEYREAVRLIPYSADARNLQDMTEAFLAEKREWKDSSPANVAKDMLGALALDPANELILSNLENLYQHMSALPSRTAGIDSDELKTKLDAVRRVQNSLKKK